MQRQETIKDLSRTSKTLEATSKYRCIVVDPPWPIQKIEREVRPMQGQVLDYPTMTIDEIGALPVLAQADPEGCHIYLWVTHKYLPAGLQLLERWGFRYQCLMTWVKNVGFTPFSWMYSTEHVLFGRVGSLDLTRMGLRLDFTGKVREHSRKPEIFFDLVRQASPGPRLEMFARERRDGFDLWGNETERFTSVEAGQGAI
ncbi:MAG: MT-A70 family methyltransferase [Armatimonadota bacterium]|nr:MT-A70 family methyltransferase [Armatimonadota bacterium]